MITIDSHKGPNKFKFWDECRAAISDMHSEEFTKCMQEKRKACVDTQIEICKGNVEEIFLNHSHVTINFSNNQTVAKIKELSDYYISYRCGETCLSLLTIDVLALYHQTKEALLNKTEIPIFKCPDGYNLGENETMAIYKMFAYLPTM